MKNRTTAGSLIALVLLLSSWASAQSIWGHADLSYNDSNQTETATCSTELDYDVAVYYEARVSCQILKNGVPVSSLSGTDVWQQGYIDVTVGANADPDSDYTAVGSHIALLNYFDYDYDEQQHLHYTYYEYFNFYYFTNFNIYSFLSNQFLGPGPLQNRPANTLSIGKTHDDNHTPAAPRFTIQYTNFIPVDHVGGSIFSPLKCFYATDIPLTYMGDAGRGANGQPGYRAMQKIDVVPDTRQSSAYSADTGESRSYGFGSPANGSTLSGLDEDGQALDCYLWHNSDHAGKGNIAPSSPTYPQSHQASVRMNGSASDPLELLAPSVAWDVTTLIDATNRQNMTATVTYSVSCYPSHRVIINGTVITLFNAPSNSFSHLSQCLTVMPPETGQQGPIRVGTQ